MHTCLTEHTASQPAACTKHLRVHTSRPVTELVHRCPAAPQPAANPRIQTASSLKLAPRHVQLPQQHKQRSTPTSAPVHRHTILQPPLSGSRLKPAVRFLHKNGQRAFPQPPPFSHLTRQPPLHRLSCAETSCGWTVEVAWCVGGMVAVCNHSPLILFDLISS